jgi:hypothetical protein
MAKRVKLNTAPVAFSIIGISSHENDYRLSWSINEQMGLSFVQGDSLLTNAKEFTCFVHEDEDRKILLFSNRCDNGFLLDKYKNFDFLLKFDAELNETEINAWLRDLRKVPLVSAVFPIPINKTIIQNLG